MSMICSLRQAAETDIDRLLAHPEQIVDFLDEDAAGQGGEIDLDKAWHGIHFLLTGSVWEGDAPLGYLVAGGEDIGDEDVGYGPARALRPGEVAKFDAALAAISLDDFRQRFDPKAMMEQQIYPEIWDRHPDDDDTLGYLAEYFEVLKAFVRTSTENNKGLIIWLS
jgi:hypothetical protein